MKPVGRHFRLPGHEPHSDLVMIPIEKISDKEPFLRKARESFYMNLFSTQKKGSVFEIEHGLNLDKGQGFAGRTTNSNMYQFLRLSYQLFFISVL